MQTWWDALMGLKSAVTASEPAGTDRETFINPGGAAREGRRPSPPTRK